MLFLSLAVVQRRTSFGFVALNRGHRGAFIATDSPAVSPFISEKIRKEIFSLIFSLLDGSFCLLPVAVPTKAGRTHVLGDGDKASLVTHTFTLSKFLLLLV